MTFDQIWEQLVQKQPKLAEDASKVEFTAGHLRRLLRQVYEQGQASVPRESASSHDAFNIFTDLLGK